MNGPSAGPRHRQVEPTQPTSQSEEPPLALEKSSSWPPSARDRSPSPKVDDLGEKYTIGKAAVGGVDSGVRCGVRRSESGSEPSRETRPVFADSSPATAVACFRSQPIVSPSLGMATSRRIMPLASVGRLKETSLRASESFWAPSAKLDATPRRRTSHAETGEASSPAAPPGPWVRSISSSSIIPMDRAGDDAPGGGADLGRLSALDAE